MQHETYRADDPPARLMGMGCKRCGEEAQIPILDFKKTGDLDAYFKLVDPFLSDEQRKAAKRK
jgi:hypothetical protein